MRGAGFTQSYTASPFPKRFSLTGTNNRRQSFDFQRLEPARESDGGAFSTDLRFGNCVQTAANLSSILGEVRANCSRLGAEAEIKKFCNGMDGRKIRPRIADDRGTQGFFGALGMETAGIADLGLLP